MSDSDSLPLSVMTCMPDNGMPKAFMQIAHGMCGYKERYLSFMEYMTRNGAACVANDHRGHGASVKSHYLNFNFNLLEIWKMFVPLWQLHGMVHSPIYTSGAYLPNST